MRRNTYREKRSGALCEQSTSGSIRCSDDHALKRNRCRISFIVDAKIFACMYVYLRKFCDCAMSLAVFTFCVREPRRWHCRPTRIFKVNRIRVIRKNPCACVMSNAKSRASLLRTRSTRVDNMAAGAGATPACCHRVFDACGVDRNKSVRESDSNWIACSLRLNHIVPESRTSSRDRMNSRRYIDGMNFESKTTLI